MAGTGTEILLRERVAFFPTCPVTGTVPDGAPSVGEEQGERAFRWDGQAFESYAPDGPAAPSPTSRPTACGCGSSIRPAL